MFYLGSIEKNNLLNIIQYFPPSKLRVNGTWQNIHSQPAVLGNQKKINIQKENLFYATWQMDG